MKTETYKDVEQQFHEIVDSITSAQSMIYSTANSTLIDLYFQIGKYLYMKEEEGCDTIQQLALFIQQNIVGNKDLSEAKLCQLKQFYETYKDADKETLSMIKQISWSNNYCIMSLCKSVEERDFYIKLSISKNLSPDSLRHQIAENLFKYAKSDAPIDMSVYNVLVDIIPIFSGIRVDKNVVNFLGGEVNFEGFNVNPTVNNKTLIVYNDSLNKFGCYALLSSKIYNKISSAYDRYDNKYDEISEDNESKLYIQAPSIIIVNQQRFAQQILDKENNWQIMLENIKGNKGLKIDPPFSFISTAGKAIVVTFLKEKSWYEIVGGDIKIFDDFMVNVYVPYSIPHIGVWNDGGPNKRAIDEFKVKTPSAVSNSAVRPGPVDPQSQRHCVRFPINMLYSIEILGEVKPERKQLKNRYTTGWNFGNVLFTCLDLDLDYSKKMIYGTYEESEHVGWRRTSSDGTVQEWCYRTARFEKTFSLIYNLKKYIRLLPVLLAKLNGVVVYDETNKIPSDASFPKKVSIKLDEPISFHQINEVLKFDVDAYEELDW